jgi:hypothetical protein
MRNGELPQQCILAKKSKYRRNIAALAKPLDPKRAKTLELADALREHTIETSGIYVDLDKGHIARSWSETTGPDEILWKLFYNDGVFFDTTRGLFFVGPLQGSEKNCGIEIFISALEGMVQRCSGYMPERWIDESIPSVPPRIILNTVCVLEDAVSRINMFRYNEVEPMSWFLFRSDEGSEANKPILKSRLKKILPQGQLRKINYEKLVNKLAEGDTGIHGVLPKLFAIRHLGLEVQGSYVQDEIEHTLNLCNIISRSTVVKQIMLHNEFMRRVKQAGVPSKDMAALEMFLKNQMVELENISWLADMAYSSPHIRLGDMQCSALQPGHVLSESEILFLSYSNQRILQELGVRPTPQDDWIISKKMNRYFKLLSTSSTSFRNATAKILDGIYIQLTGKSLFETFPELEGQFKKVQETEFIRAEDLSDITEQWKKENILE